MKLKAIAVDGFSVELKQETVDFLVTVVLFTWGAS